MATTPMCSARRLATPVSARRLAALLLLSLPAWSSSTPRAAEPAGAPWQNVAIGGGGYVLQTHFSAATPHAYMRTDVGGIYLRAADAAAPGGFTWAPLLDAFGPGNASMYGVSQSTKRLISLS